MGNYGDKVTTHADGFGNWHAVIECRDGGYGNAGQWAIDRHWDRLRAMARRAIRRELVARGDIGEGYRLRIQLVEHKQFGTGQSYRLEFAESI